jgi:hypothetical protein
MADFHNHHIVPEGLRASLNAIGIDIDTYAWNRIDLPRNPFGGVPTHGLEGNHTYVGYRGGIERALQNILNTVPPAQQKAAVTRLMVVRVTHTFF